MTNKAKIEITNVNLEQATKLSTSTNIRTAKCLNNKATSAKLRCSLSSNLVNIKSVGDVYLDLSQIKISNLASEVSFKFNHDFVFNEISTNTGSILNLNFNAAWFLNGQAVDSIALDSDKLPNNNVLDAITPPSSCFQMKMIEEIDQYRVSFTATAKIAVYNDAGNRITGDSLRAIKPVATVFDDKLIEIPLTGHMDTNLIGTEHSEILPCAAL